MLPGRSSSTIWKNDSHGLKQAQITLSGIQRRTLIILVAMVAGSGFLGSFLITGSLAIGGLISLANFWGLRAIGERAFRTRPIFLVALMGKFLVLLGLLFTLIVYTGIHKVAFAAGLSVAFLAITLEGLMGYFKAKEEV